MKLNDIHTNPDNPRLIKDDKFKKLVASIKDFPKMMSLRPIVVDDTMTILGGNMRYKALQEAGYTEIDDSWVKIAKELTDAEKKRFVIEDNMPFGEWDWELLGNNYEIADLLDWGFDEKDLKIEQDIEEDEAPEVSDEPAISKLGEVYQLGRHRLMCGDSTEIEQVEKLMGGQKADLLLTDPPYGVGYIGKTDKALTIDNDAKTSQEMHDFWVKVFSNMNAVSKSGCSYYCCSSQGGEMMMMSLFDSGFLVKQQIIWKKNTIVMGHSDYQFQHEPLFYGWKKDGSHQFYGDRTQSSVWEINKPSASREHPTMKPVELFVRPIKNSSKSDDIVLDLFGGSGSTLIACEQTNRICYGMEIDPKYCDVIRKRYAKFIGKENEWQTITPIVKQ
jgi:DNA modification methylase